jgi:membrane associated rhomboid family serine protease
MIPIRDMIRSRRFPVVTVSLIVINLLIFLYQGYLGTREPLWDNWSDDRSAWIQAGHEPPPIFDPSYAYTTQRLPGQSLSTYAISRDDWFLMQYALIPDELLGGTDLPPTIPVPLWLTLFSAMFLHGSILHVLGNMLYLWIFGDNVEDAMGPVRFLVFYLLCGTVAAFAQIAIAPGSSVPTIGASGAIAGVLGAYFVLYPYAKVLTIIPIFFFLRLIAIPAVFLIGFWFVLQVISGAGSFGASGGVAWFAHIGGFVAGLLLVGLFRRRAVPLTLWRSLRYGRFRH